MPPRLEINTGDRFCRLVIVMEVEKSGEKRCFLCKCDCGRQIKTRLSYLRSGHKKSCNCLQKESQKISSRTHGGSKTRLYRTWAGMKQRCNDEKTPLFEYYGARGISVCLEWIYDFAAFREWAVASGYSDSLTIERVNHNGNYEPTNCTWIPKGRQSFNTRKNIVFTYNGKTMILKEWSRHIGMAYMKLYKRIVTRGWSVEKAFNTP